MHARTAHTRCAQCTRGVWQLRTSAVVPAELLDYLTITAPCCAALPTCEQNARHELCAKAGGTATAGTRHAASTLAARLAPPGTRGRPAGHFLLTLHACVPRQLKAEPSEAAALAQPRLIARPRQQLGSPTRRSEWSRPISWSAEASGPSHGQP